MITILAAVIILIVSVYFYTRYKKRGYDIDVPTPKVFRTDLLYGYYGCELNQVKQVKDHVNLHWESQFNGATRASDDINEMQRFTILDVMHQLFYKFTDKGRNYRLYDNAESKLILFLNYLQETGALKYVKALVPIDEPNINCINDEELSRACDIIQRVAAGYPELNGVKLACIYAPKPTPFGCIERFDLVGVDDYELKSRVLQGIYQQLLKEKRPDAKTILLPGGGFGQNPTPFINWAHNDHQVAIVLPFVWFGPREPRDTWIGIGVGELKEQYVSAGKSLIEKENNNE